MQQLQLVLRGGTLERAPEDLSIEVDGESRLLTYSLTPVSHTQGHILGAVMVLHDVTEQRAFERVRSEFVLRASHELRTPVTGMHMAFGLFRERAKFAAGISRGRPARHGQRRNAAPDAVDQRLAQLLALPERLAETHARAVLHRRFAGTGAAALCRFGRGQRHRLELSKCKSPLPRLQADQAQLDRVLDNLIDNALRHTARDGQIRLQARRHGERVIISVEDNGEGIAYGQQGRIFEPFVQVGRKKGGAGLGLALCKEIVQLHGGRMGVYSRPGQGTQFYMALAV